MEALGAVDSIEHLDEQWFQRIAVRRTPLQPKTSRDSWAVRSGEPEKVAIGTAIADSPRTNPYGQGYRIRLLPLRSRR